jgi:hypothetical protein
LDEVIRSQALRTATSHPGAGYAKRGPQAGVAALLALLTLTPIAPGCAVQKPAQRPVASQDHLARLEPLVVAGAIEPYRARGAAQFTYRGETESGELSVQAEPGPAYRIQLRARISGSLALDLRFDELDLLIVDYVHESYLLGGNTSATRNELFSLDMNPLDFRMALTGRVPAEVFRQGQGQRQPSEAHFFVAADEYRFTLDEFGLPSQWTKRRGGVAALRVEYRSYLELPTGQGAPLRLPGRIRVYGAESQPRLILGIQEWRIGAEPDAPPITFIPPPDVLERFHPQ